MNLRNKDKLYIYKRDNKKCFYCAKKLLLKQITLDHYLPLSKGGTDDIFNVVISCKKCNKLKNDSIPDQFEETILVLLKRAVKDDMIIGKSLNIDNKKLKEEMLKIERIECITDHFVFQSKDMRFYIKDNFVIKVIYLGGYSDEYNDNFCWED